MRETLQFRLSGPTIYVDVSGGELSCLLMELFSDVIRSLRALSLGQNSNRTITEMVVFLINIKNGTL